MAKENSGLTVGDETITDAEVQHAGFTDIELAALKDGEDEGEETGEEAEATEGEKPEGESGTKPEGEEAEGEGEEAEGAEGAEGAEKPEGEAAAEGEAEGEKPEDEAVAVADDDPQLLALNETRSVLPSEWTMPDGGVTKARENLTNLDQQAKELATKFDDGHLSASEYREQAGDINNRIADLRGDIREAERAFGKAMVHWGEKTVGKFLRENPEWQNETMLRALDGEVKALQHKNADPFDPRHLLVAARKLKAAMGIAPAQQEKPAAGTQAQQRAQPKIPTGKRAEVPPTLARVPADEISDTDGGKFARLDRLQVTDPLAWQDALGKMSDADRDAYGAS